MSMSYPFHVHVFSMTMSCLCHIHILPMLCPCQVYVRSMPCPCHVNVMSMSCQYHINVKSMSSLCHPCVILMSFDVHVMSMSDPCPHVLKPTLIEVDFVLIDIPVRPWEVLPVLFSHSRKFCVKRFFLY